MDIHRSSYEDESIELLAEILTTLKSIDEKLGKKSSSRNKTPVSSHIWESFREPYFAKYGVEPARNAKVNGQLSQLSRRVSADHIQSLCNYYLSQNDAKYTRNYHSVGMLLQDCEILLTRMRSGVVITESKARDIERRQDSANASVEYLNSKYGREF